MPSINLKKELYDKLILKGIPVTPFVTQAVYFRIRNIEQNKQAVNISQNAFDYIEKNYKNVELFVNTIVKDKLDNPDSIGDRSWLKKNQKELIKEIEAAKVKKSGTDNED